MILLSIETSCDETSIAILKKESEMIQILAHIVHSQIDIHREFGGVFPALAKREHQLNLVPVLVSVLEKAQLISKVPTVLSSESKSQLESILEREPELHKQLLKFFEIYSIQNIEGIAITIGPGLAPALWVGLNFAKALCFVLNIPLLPVNHMEGHLFSVQSIKNSIEATLPKTPTLGLLISGGHTEYVATKDYIAYEVLGKTKDDAIGEAYDKVARMLDLPYPGGPEISKLAVQGVKRNGLTLPRPLLHSHDLDFSFSGLKTAVKYYIKDQGELDEQHKADIAFEFEESVCEVLIHKTRQALQDDHYQSFVIAGGVIANNKIRSRLIDLIESEFKGIKIYLPESSLATDNAAMIGIVALLSPNQPRLSFEQYKDITALPNLEFGDKVA